MRKIGMTVSRPDVDAPAAEHFGKAKWILVLEPPDRCEFVPNAAVHGSAVADELASRGCTDVIARHMGPGAHGRLTAAGTKVWRADETVTGRTAAEALARGALRPLAPELEAHGHPPGHGGHCHCRH